LLDASGLVIGVVQSKLDALRVMGAIGDVPQNVNFAISIEALAEFLEKNKVPIRDGVATPPLDTSKVAEMAQSFTYRVECQSNGQAEVFLDKKARPEASNDLKKLAVGTVFQDCDHCPEMIVIAPGSFVMGRKSDEWHSVSIPRRFAVGKFEVTFAQWQACVEARACSHRPDDNGWGYGSQPVINVSWLHAKQYTFWLSLKTGESYRLLTEAEWEYVARAGTTTSFHWGNNYSEVCQFETVNQGAGGCGEQKPSLVGHRRPNPFGVHDMLGNVQEWVEDCKNVKLYGAPADGSAWRNGDCASRIFRGGNWNTKIKADLWALRWAYGTTARNANLGFRVARD